jgi:hypothetical protein
MILIYQIDRDRKAPVFYRANDREIHKERRPKKKTARKTASGESSDYAEPLSILFSFL